MIRTEEVYIDGRLFIKTYSDAGRYIHGGDPEGDYEEVLDPAEFGRTYTEGNLIPYEDPGEEDYAAAGRIMLGVEE